MIVISDEFATNMPDSKFLIVPPLMETLLRWLRLIPLTKAIADPGPVIVCPFKLIFDPVGSDGQTVARARKVLIENQVSDDGRAA